ncbi:MAG: hypothetical protein AAF242_13880 [Bacteroidota bacterium]
MAALTEILVGAGMDQPWYPGDNVSQLPNPHGLGLDINGFLYISETGHNLSSVRKLNCAGEIFPVDANTITFDGTKQNLFSIGNTIYANTELGPSKFDACSGAFLEQVCLANALGGTIAPVNLWGLSYNSNTNTIYATSRLGGNQPKENRSNVWSFSPEAMDAAIEAGTCIDPLITEGPDSALVAGDNATPFSAGSLFGVVGDNEGFIYVVKSTLEGGATAQLPSPTPGAHILKYTSDGRFIRR